MLCRNLDKIKIMVKRIFIDVNFRYDQVYFTFHGSVVDICNIIRSVTVKLTRLLPADHANDKHYSYHATDHVSGIRGHGNIVS